MLKIFKILFLILFFELVSSGSIHAQVPNFQWAKNAIGTNAESGESIAVDGNGNVLVAGHFFSSTVSFGTFSLTNSGMFDFFIVKYDAAGNVLWAKSGGGLFFDYAKAIVTDNAGNVYVAGTYYSPSITVGNSTLTSAGGADGFLIKYNSAGNQIWVKNIGGDMDDLVSGIAADQNGNIYITGSFQSSSLVCDNYTLTSPGSAEAFVAKYDGSGNIIWARNFEGSNDDVGNSIAVDGSENVFVTGNYTSPFLMIDSYTLTNVGSSDAFVTKLNSLGNAVWAKSVGGTFNDSSSEITLDPLGNIYIAGDFNSSTITVESFTLTNFGNFDFFIAKYNAAGNAIWAKVEGDINDEVCTGLSTDVNANLYVTGHFHGLSLTLGTFTLINNGAFGGDMYIAKYNTAGNIDWATSIGGANDDGTSCIASDFSGNIYVSGFFASANITCSAITLTNTGNADMFVGKIESTVTGFLNNTLYSENSVLVYPNPSNGIFQISGKTHLIEGFEIYNEIGEIIFSSQNSQMNLATIDLSSKPKGFYFVKIRTGQKSEMKKVIIH